MLCFRRKHRKGQEEETTKKKTRRTQKFQRAIVGASLTDILAKRNMKPEMRKAQRDIAIKYVLNIPALSNCLINSFIRFLVDVSAC